METGDNCRIDGHYAQMQTLPTVVRKTYMYSILCLTSYKVYYCEKAMVIHLAGFFISSVTKFKLFLCNENKIKKEL